MSALKQAIVVIGGNGFLGSAVCRRALAKGMDVTSISSTGRPFTTPKGHSPAWVQQINWHAASALDPPSYVALLNNKTAVVHTLGVLLEGGYKSAVRNNDAFGVLSSFARNLGLGGDAGNPLSKSKGPSEYETINRDSALRVFETYEKAANDASKTFVYISAEDIFRPFVPRGYIDTKREAEALISQRAPAAGIRDVFIRPGLMYHPHLRPMTTPLAVLLDISSHLHQNAPTGVTRVLPSSLLRTAAQQFTSESRTAVDFATSPTGDSSAAGSSSSYSTTGNQVGPSPLSSVANALEIPPIHVDQVADAIVAVLQRRTDVCGPVGVDRMRDILGWTRESPRN